MKSLNFFILFSAFMLVGVCDALAQNEKTKNDTPATEVSKKIKDKDSDKSENLKSTSSEEETKRAKRKKGAQSMTSIIDEKGNEIFSIEEKDPVTGEIKFTELVVERQDKGVKPVKEKNVKSKTKSKTTIEKQ
ncbi:hypothetical protein [Aquimarina intermedia]|uniref:Uncharacterized protein n=1 Tax=Aquimarina intermedia TaxID=350814 RepID=A0A5S5BTV2_9FLAO|nr:hypothetical protein [Aquimarina intermedia]TYP70384.1 hypothetical protein BD809_11348 [Aquimarina intermedia]